MAVTFFRTAIMYIIILAIMRFSGKRQLGELQISELVVTILISELAAIPMQDLDAPVLNGVVSIIVLVCLEIIVSFICMKSTVLRKLFEGHSCILIENGKIDQAQMKKVRFTIDDLMESLRQKGVSKIEAVNTAILETSGKVSVLLKDTHSPATKKQIDPKTKNEQLPISVISDGKFIKQGLEKSGFSKAYILSILHKKGFKSEKEVFYMTVEDDAEPMIIKKELN